MADAFQQAETHAAKLLQRSSGSTTASAGGRLRHLVLGPASAGATVTGPRLRGSCRDLYGLGAVRRGPLRPKRLHRSHRALDVLGRCGGQDHAVLAISAVIASSTRFISLVAQCAASSPMPGTISLIVGRPVSAALLTTKVEFTYEVGKP